MKRKKVKISIVMITIFVWIALSGCGNLISEKQNDTQDDYLQENVILTETGEVIEEEASATPMPESTEASATTVPSTVTPLISTEKGDVGEVMKPAVELKEPEQEQVIAGEEHVVPNAGQMQLVFLGDSIFDNNRDGTGVPYLTASQCDAVVYNLAIGGTSATVEWEEHTELENWTSRSLCGIVNAMMDYIPTDIFEGSSAKALLDNPDIDFSNTDYFIIEYGLNDYFRAVPLNIENTTYDIRCYTGALRYAICTLHGVAPDATIILCAPNYAQFYTADGFMIGDGNSINTGYGTLFDYKGTCNYVANEQQTLFFNAYQDLGINGYTAEEYLEDGVHLSTKGRQLYADALAKMILTYEETKNN